MQQYHTFFVYNASLVFNSVDMCVSSRSLIATQSISLWGRGDSNPYILWCMKTYIYEISSKQVTNNILSSSPSLESIFLSRSGDTYEFLMQESRDSDPYGWLQTKSGILFSMHWFSIDLSFSNISRRIGYESTCKEGIVITILQFCFGKWWVCFLGDETFMDSSLLGMENDRSRNGS